MHTAVSDEYLRGIATCWLVVEQASPGLPVVGCYQVSKRRADYLAERIVEAGRGDVVVSIEGAPRYSCRNVTR
jgi:hypothetical protein